MRPDRLATAENVRQSAFLGLPKEMETRRLPSLVANFPQMNFTQIHERLRLELLRRIQRGTLTVSLLARQTGLGQPHLSNFLNSRRQLSLDALDRVLAAQRLQVPDLLPALQQALAMPFEDDSGMVPLVSHAAALFEPFIRPSAVQAPVHLPAGLLESIQARVAANRRTWQRFVAIRIQAEDAKPMEPLVFPDAIAVLDRHYTSPARYRPDRPNLFAVRHGAHVTLRYVEFLSGKLLLRPYNIGYPVDLIELEPDESAADPIAGRVALILNET